MPLIDYTYFTGEIMIPGIGSTGPERTALTEAIARYEPEYLKKLLGVELYGLFTAAYAIDPVTMDARYRYILNGHSYSISDIDYVWGGLINTAKLSPLAYYVWFKYTSDPNYSGTGVSDPKVENATKNAMLSRTKYCRVWNQMADWNRDLHDMTMGLLSGDDRVYPEFNTARYFYLLGGVRRNDRYGYELFHNINPHGI